MIAEALGNKGAADEASLAVEFFHTASLIADDLPCMDNDTMRRGRSSTHIVYGESTALLASYALIASGYEYIARNGAQLEGNSSHIMHLALENVALNTGFEGATGGQWLDLFAKNPDPEEIKRILFKKTVSLFELAFVLGWLFGGGPIEDLSEIKQCAAHFGYAFQIADDLHDATQNHAHVSGVNYALSVGFSQARQECLNEIDAFSKRLERLNISLHPLKSMARELSIAIALN